MAKNIAQSQQPTVSVVMSVYNCEAFVGEAVDSILAQTFTDFEFIIIDDGSTDATLDVLNGYADKRIKLTSRKNKGLVASLNEGIDRANGEYIARQDADDWSAPNRLELQIKQAKATRSAVIGSAFAMIDLQGKVVGYQAAYEDNASIQTQLRVSNPFGHGSILMRRDVVQDIGKYRKSVGPVEDYDLWIRLAPTVSMSGINEVLYFWRVNPSGISHRQTSRQVQSAERLKRAYNIAADWKSPSLTSSVTQYYRLLLSSDSLNRLLAKQMIRERFQYHTIPQASGQKLRTELVTACLQPGAALLFLQVIMRKVSGKIRYLLKRGARS